MKHLEHWRIKNEAKSRILKSEKGKIGNELPDNKVVAGGDLKTGPKQFKGQLEGFKSKINNSKDNAEPLGDKGMDAVGKSTFANPVGAGETPTVSNGIPVGEPQGQFESFRAFRSFKEFAPAAAPGVGETGAPPIEDPMAEPVAMQEPPAEEEEPMANDQNPFKLPATVMMPLQKAFLAAQRLGPQQYKGFVMALQQMTRQGMSDSSMTDGMGRTVQRQQIQGLRQGL